ncbi:MAG: AAA family ATPase, partial [Actinobacteria bacterium]|nr:AAA family ATPase [Actinomycetota bacterium]
MTSAYATGGSLLKFGGDALLIFFDGNDHPTRAAISAMRMRTALGDRGPIKTDGGGAIRLRMSVGVHSGDVHFFRVGTSHRELLVTGPAASAVCSMESAAVAGQIMVSPATAGAISRRLLGEASGPGVLLKRRRLDAELTGYPELEPVKRDLRHAIPFALRDALLSGVEPEHRLATIAFVHFDGIDSFLAAHGEADTAAALHDLVSEVQQAVDDEKVTFLGSDLDHDGGKLILAGGAPRAFGDDEGRVLRCVRRIVDAHTRIPVRVGVNRGHVFAGEVGPAYRRTYTVMGDTVNLAARLMAKAEPGQIISTGDVMDAAQTLFASETIPPFHVKGKSAPITAFTVGATKGRRRLAGSDPLPFVGRQAELAAITQRWAMARSGEGGFVAVFGEAGIGKSRLLREFTNHAPDVRTITAFCETYQATTPYFAARFLLRGALGLPSDAPTEVGLRSAVTRQAPELLPWLPLIGAVAAIDVPATAEVDALDPEFRRARTVQVIVDLLDAALTKPVALIVDDAHWLDELSGELLVGIAAARRRPWVIVLAGRLEVDAYTPPTEALDLALNLTPLDNTAAGALLTSADQAAHIRPDQRNAILQRSGGNPLFLEQLAARIDTAGATALPDSLETLVAAEIDALGAVDRNAVRLAAVLGPIFDTGLLLELVGVPALSDVLSARLARFLEPIGDAAVRFRNQTYRDVAYETLSFGRRRDLHGRAFSAIETAAGDATDDQAEVLSYHALHGRDFARCWHYSRVAAVKAENSYANVEAATLLERALMAGAQLGVAERDAMAATWEQLGDVSLKAGTFDRAK